MSDKPIAITVATLIAAPLAVGCCAIGPATFLALASGAFTGTITTLTSDFSLTTTLLLTTMVAFASLFVWNWWRKKKSNSTAELEGTYGR